jgi:hypothetical protein
MEQSDFPNPRFEAQMEGEGDANAIDLMKAVSNRQPVFALRDTITKRYVVVLPAMATGDESVIWTQDPIDGRRKFRTDALVPPRFIDANADVSLSDSNGFIFQVKGDHPVYQRERSRAEV